MITGNFAGSSLEDRFWAAYEAAATPLAADMHSLAAGEDMSLYPVLAGLEDADELPGTLGEPTESGGLIKLEHPLQYFAVLGFASDYLGLYNSPDTVFDKVLHERQHAAAAEILGLTAIHAARFKQFGSGEIGMKVTTIPVGGPVTKLGFASILAHPSRLSKSDLRKLDHIGYSGPHDVARHITDSGVNYPRPLSVKL